MILMGVGNQETTINNKVRAMEKNIRARSCQLKHPWLKIDPCAAAKHKIILSRPNIA